MKYLTFLFILFLVNCSANGQVHWLINSDSIPDCNFIKSGKFINKITDSQSTPDYYIVYEDSLVTDFVEGGKYYVKSKITYQSECKWESEIIEITIPNYDLEVGYKITTEILETALVDKLVKIKVMVNGEEKEYIFVLEKIE